MAAGARAWSWAPWRVEDAEAWVWLCALCLPVLLAEPQFPPSEIQFLTSEPRASVLTHWTGLDRNFLLMAVLPTGVDLGCCSRAKQGLTQPWGLSPSPGGDG